MIKLLAFLDRMAKTLNKINLQINISMVVNENEVNSFSGKFDPGDNKSGRDTEIIFYKVEK